MGDLCEQAQSERSEQEEERRQLDELLDYSGYPGGEASSRPRSWSPHHSPTHILIKPHNLGKATHHLHFTLVTKTSESYTST